MYNSFKKNKNINNARDKREERRKKKGIIKDENIELDENKNVNITTIEKEVTEIKQSNRKKIKFVDKVSSEYKTIKIIPGFEPDNIGTYFIAKSIAELANIKKILKKKDGALFQITEQEKAVFIIDLSADKVCFYFVLSIDFEPLLRERINEIFKNCKIEDVQSFQISKDNVAVDSLGYKYNDTLSLNTECVSDLNDLIINSQWLEENDRVVIMYNLFPITEKEFRPLREECFRKIKEEKTIDLLKNKISGEYIADKMREVSIWAMDGVFDIIDGLVSGYNNKINKYSNRPKIDPMENLSSFSKAKLYNEKLGVQIALLSYSDNEKRRKYNLHSIESSYASFNNDNQLKRVKAELPNLYDSKWKMPINIMSLNEVSQFVTFPKKYVLTESINVEQVNVKQSKALDYLAEGNFYLGENDYKGKVTKVHIPRDYDSESLAHVFIAPQGSGKTTLLTNLTIDSVKSGQGNVILDYIKNCEYADKVIPFIPKEKLVIINADDIHTLPVLDFNEYKIKPNSTEEEIGKIMDKKKMATEKIIETLNENQQLTASMSRILTSACDIAYAFEGTSFNDVIEIIQNWKVRESFMKRAENLFFTDRVLNKRIEEALLNLESINDYDNEKDDDGNKIKVLVGTKESKVNGLLDRISKLNKSYILSTMLYGTKNEIDFTKILSEGKTIVVKLPEHLVSEYEKNVISTFITMKTILSTFIRGKEEHPLRCNLWIDEIYQIPTVENVINEYLNRLRKMGLKVILTVHRLTQLNNTKFQKELLSSGASFSLLAGCKEVHFRDFQEYVGDFTLEDIINLKPFHALHIIHTNKNGDWIGTTKLPSKL